MVNRLHSVQWRPFYEVSYPSPDSRATQNEFFNSLRLVFPPGSALD